MTRSLIDGLKSVGADFNYNPVDKEQVAETVVVLADRGALGQAIAWKSAGEIKRLIAGPNLVVLPSDDIELITSRQIDIYLVNSEWTHRSYIDDAPALESNCKIWAAGVDTGFWKPAADSGQHRHILVYQKKVSDEVAAKCCEVVSKFGFTHSILKYGEYDADRFLCELRRSAAAVFLSRSESQGIALAESWAVNVPTIVWNPGVLVYGGKTLLCSAAPYLTDATGLCFARMEDFESVFMEWQEKCHMFSPRKWVVSHMTDKICALNILELAGIAI